MKRAVAIIGAVAMVVVAFVVRGIGDDDGSGAGGDSQSVMTVICPTDFEEICGGLDGVEVIVEPAGDTADRLLAATAEDNSLDRQVWVIPSAWADLVQDTRRFHDAVHLFHLSDAIASTTPAVAIYQDRESQLDCVDIDWTCLSNAPSLKVATPPVDSAIGLPLLGAQLVEVAGTTDLSRNDVRLLPPFRQQEDAFDVMRTVLGRFDASASTLAEAGGVSESPSGLPISVVEPGTDARIDLVLVTRRDERTSMSNAVGQPLSDDVVDAITEAFLDAGWDAPQFSDGFLPNGDILNLLREEAQ